MTGYRSKTIPPRRHGTSRINPDYSGDPWVKPVASNVCASCKLWGFISESTEVILASTPIFNQEVSFYYSTSLHRLQCRNRHIYHLIHISRFQLDNRQVYLASHCVFLYPTSRVMPSTWQTCFFRKVLDSLPLESKIRRQAQLYLNLMSVFYCPFLFADNRNRHFLYLASLVGGFPADQYMWIQRQLTCACSGIFLIDGPSNRKSSHREIGWT